MLRLYLIVASLVLGLQAKLVVHQYETCKDWEDGSEPVVVYSGSCEEVPVEEHELPEKVTVRSSVKENLCKVSAFRGYSITCPEGELREEFTVKRGSCVEDEDRVYTCESTDPFNDDGWIWVVIVAGSVLGLAFYSFAGFAIHRAGSRKQGPEVPDRLIDRIRADAAKSSGVAGASYPGKTFYGSDAAAPGMVRPGEWSVPLFACPVGESCLMSWCCTPCAVAETRRRFYAYSRDRCMIEGCCMTFWDMALTAAGIGVCMPVTSVLLTSTRGSVREARDYGGSPFNDFLCACCCTCCTSLQLERDQQIADEIGSPAGNSMSDDGVSLPEYGNDFPAGQRSGSRGGRGRRGRSRPL